MLIYVDIAVDISHYCYTMVDIKSLMSIRMSIKMSIASSALLLVVAVVGQCIPLTDKSTSFSFAQLPLQVQFSVASKQSLSVIACSSKAYVNILSNINPLRGSNYYPSNMNHDLVSYAHFQSGLTVLDLGVIQGTFTMTIALNGSLPYEGEGDTASIGYYSIRSASMAKYLVLGNPVLVQHEDYLEMVQLTLQHNTSDEFQLQIIPLTNYIPTLMVDSQIRHNTLTGDVKSSSSLAMISQQPCTYYLIATQPQSQSQPSISLVTGVLHTHSLAQTRSNQPLMFAYHNNEGSPFRISLTPLLNSSSVGSEGIQSVSVSTGNLSETFSNDLHNVTINHSIAGTCMIQLTLKHDSKLQGLTILINKVNSTTATTTTAVILQGTNLINMSLQLLELSFYLWSPIVTGYVLSCNQAMESKLYLVDQWGNRNLQSDSSNSTIAFSNPNGKVNLYILSGSHTQPVGFYSVDLTRQSQTDSETDSGIARLSPSRVSMDRFTFPLGIKYYKINGPTEYYFCRESKCTVSEINQPHTTVIRGTLASKSDSFSQVVNPPSKVYLSVGGTSMSSMVINSWELFTPVSTPLLLSVTFCDQMVPVFGSQSFEKQQQLKSQWQSDDLMLLKLEVEGYYFIRIDQPAEVKLTIKEVARNTTLGSISSQDLSPSISIELDSDTLKVELSPIGLNDLSSQFLPDSRILYTLLVRNTTKSSKTTLSNLLKCANYHLDQKLVTVTSLKLPSERVEFSLNASLFNWKLDVSAKAQIVSGAQKSSPYAIYYGTQVYTKSSSILIPILVALGATLMIGVAYAVGKLRKRCRKEPNIDELVEESTYVQGGNHYPQEDKGKSVEIELPHLDSKIEEEFIQDQ